MYRNVTDFCISVLYPAALSNSRISSSSLLVASLQFSVYSSKLSSKVTVLFCFVFYFFLSNLDSFFFFFNFSAVARTAKAILNKIGKSGILVLLILECFQIFIVEYDVWFALYVLHYVEVCSLYAHVLIRNGCWILSKAFLYQDDHMVFSL